MPTVAPAPHRPSATGLRLGAGVPGVPNASELGCADTRVARERLAAILDPGSFQPLFHAGCCGALAGAGFVAGREVVAWAQDPAYAGGSLGVAEGDLITRAIALANERQMPVIGLVHSAGARIQEGTAALHAYARIFRAQALSRVPQLSVICGTSAGGGAYSPALGDIVIMIREAGQLFLTGPRVVHEVTGEEVSAEALGGAGVHTRNGVAHLVATDLSDARALVKDTLDHLPPGAGRPAKRTPPADPAPGDPAAVLPASSRKVYDIRTLIARLVDGGELLELSARWAPNLVSGLARLDGWPIGVVANQPRWLGGTLDARASEKGAWFVNLCERFGLPLAVIVDCPGFLPGSVQERKGVIRSGAALVSAFARASVPRATVTVRAAYGGAQIAMNSRGLGATASLAWPQARLGVMGAAQAVQIVNRRALAAGSDPVALAAAYEAEQLLPTNAAETGAIDLIIAPASTRAHLIRALVSPSAGRAAHHRASGWDARLPGSQSLAQDLTGGDQWP